MTQLSIFDEPPPVEALVDDEARALADRLPRGVRFGCSTWTFTGWGGVVYRGRPTETQLARHGLHAYARHPLHGLAEVDRSFYRPLTVEELRRYVAQLPAGYPLASKMWSEVTTHTFAQHPRLGARAGVRNPRFLDGEAACEVLAPLIEGLGEHLGPVIFQLPPVPNMERRDPLAFARLVERLLERLPRGPRYAFELRNRELLTPRYLEVLAAHGAAHALSFWRTMPTVAEQLELAGVLAAPFAVARLSHPPGTTYEERRARLEPFDSIRDPQPEVRADVVRLARACVAEGRELFVIVDNKVEGCAPLTVRAMVSELVA
jgi:uncharacterized protein YecE (DUF72 family)